MLELDTDFHHAGAIARDWYEEVVEELIQIEFGDEDTFVLHASRGSRFGSSSRLRPEGNDPGAPHQNVDGRAGIIDGRRQGARRDFAQDAHSEAGVLIERSRGGNGKGLADLPLDIEAWLRVGSG